jgi:hypothetical protein
MKIILRNIPAAGLFYNDEREEVFDVYLEFEDGCVKDPVFCRSHDSDDQLEEADRYYAELLPYIDEVAVKRLLIESLIIDAKRDNVNHCFKRSHQMNRYSSF